MAAPARRLDTNVAGDFFVDDTCIDCATCRWMAPETFDGAGDASRVYTQPDTPDDTERALAALVACPTGSIGTTQRHANLSQVIRSFPRPIEGPVHHCGYHSEASFGAASYLLQHPDGNVLIDSPRYNRHLARRIEEMGGLRLMFLTHRDDVADHAKWHRHFGMPRVMHRRDAGHRTREIEQWLEGTDPVELLDGLTAIPTPGHTAGSACLHFDQVLFTGDTLAFSPRLGHLYAFRRACWFDWDTLVSSIEALGAFPFNRVLPGHGHPWHGPDANEQLARCLSWMRTT